VKLPPLRGTIARRILVNYRIAPDVLRPLLPAPFAPRIIHGWAMGGICLIRFRELRPRGFPASFGCPRRTPPIASRWRSDDGVTRVAVSGTVGDRLPSGSIFRSMEEASRFFEDGSRGYSPPLDVRHSMKP
jgi:hypothetical protein